jgi:hypothetical protein
MGLLDTRLRKLFDNSILVLYTRHMGKRLTAVRLKEEHLAALAAEAELQDVPVSHLIRVAVMEFLERLAEQKKEKK